MKRLGIIAACIALALPYIAAPALAQSVQQSPPVTSGHVPYWITSGVQGDGGSSADSPITSFGVTNSGSAGICDNSARQASGAWQALCMGYVSGIPTISVQNFGSAPVQPLQFIINGTTYAFPGSLANITIGTTPIIGGTNSLCLFVSGGVVGQQVCTLSAITSLTGDVTATGPGISAATLATVNGNVGTFSNPIITVNGKGLITSVSAGTTNLIVGSTTITSGTTNGLFYANGSVLGNLATLASGVLVTSAGGVPSIATTLPSALTIPSPTFTGTETFPDSATWTVSGISKVAALSAGSATIPSAGNINVSGQYQVNGTPIAASTLSNGTTGSGAVVLAASPAISGTWTGNPTFSGNVTFSGQLLETGTSGPSSAAGNTVVMGTLAAAPSLTNNGQAWLFSRTTGGATLQGQGSVADVEFFNNAGSTVAYIPTGTTKFNFPNLSAGTCSGGLALDSGSNLILDSCPGAAASIQVGTTIITSGTNGGCLYSNGGTLGNHPCITEAQGRLTLQANTPVMTTSQSAQTTLRYDCDKGGQVPYFDGTQDNIDLVASCEVTDAMVSAASAGQVVNNNVYDVWWVHSGANRICLAMSAATGGGGGWSSDAGSNTARGTGFSVLDRTTRPYTTNKNALTNCFNGATNYGSVSANQATYLGTVYASANGQISYTFAAVASNGTAGLLGVWNMYNRRFVSTTIGDSTSTWAYTTANTWRQWHGQATMQVQYVVGIAEDSVSADDEGIATAGAATSCAIGIGVDSTTAFSQIAGIMQSSTTNLTSDGKYEGVPGVGFHSIYPIEIVNSATGCTFVGTGGVAFTQTGMVVKLQL